MYSDTNTAPVAIGQRPKVRVGAHLAAFHAYVRARRELMRLQELEDYLLSDVGITRGEALRAKPRPLRHFLR